MSNLLAILAQASGSLAAHSAAAATAGHNLQNAGTAGYARQRATLGAVTPAYFVGAGWIGRGVALQGITRARDQFVEAQLPAALGGEAKARAEAEALRAVHVLDPGLPGGLSGSIADFYGSLRALSASPSDGVLRGGAVRAADTLARSFRSAAAGIRDARKAIDADLQARLPAVNDAAARFADLNRQIRAAASTGAPPNDLLDARQRLQDELVALTGAQPVAEASGDVHLLLPGGGALVSGTAAASLAVAPDPANAGLLAVQLVPPGGGAPRPLGGMGGAIGGLLSARDGALADAGRRLDRLAYDFGSALDAAHAAGVGTDGAPGGPMFQFGAVDGAALRFAVDPALLADPARLATAAPGAPAGDGANLLRLVATETGADPAGALGSLTAAFGAATARAESAAEHEAALLDHLSTLRESASGVSVDEELVELTRAQRAYEAVGKVIRVTDEMLQSLLELR